jgi:energy-coupling factor transporter ATP-binding protein EcfA2
MNFRDGMLLSEIPTVDGLDDLTVDERRAIMMIREGRSEEAPIELAIRNLFVWSILGKAEDVHIEGRGQRESPVVHVHVRLPAGIVNFMFKYPGKEGKHWEIKMFQLTGTSIGATTPEIASTRFEMELPSHFAQGHGLKPFEDSSVYPVDVRVEYTRTYNGFAFINRLLDSQRAPKLDELGLSYSLYRVILRALNEPSGLILVTGPTGSGKTTLLNAMLGVLNDGTRAIDTAENPVEIALRGIGPIKQRQIGGNITFHRALRSMLRSGPDVIMIGEIRDAETMEIALQAAQTGHLVLATLHTNDSAETYSRALDLTMDKARDAYRLAQTLKVVVAQRLVNRYEGPVVSRRLTRDEQEWLDANGLPYGDEITEVVPEKAAGKVAIIEAIVTTPEIKQIMRADRMDTSAIYRAACDQDHFEPLAVGGMRAVHAHASTLQHCIQRLEGNTDARAHPSLRVRLAKEHGLNFVQVAQAIDAYHHDADRGSLTTLDQHIATAKLAAITKVIAEENA